MRTAARTDANQTAIVGALRRCGCVVQSMAMVGDGCPDLLVGHRATRRMFAVECKDGAKVPSARRLTPDQVRWHAQWAGLPVYVVESVDQALALLAEVGPR